MIDQDEIVNDVLTMSNQYLFNHSNLFNHFPKSLSNSDYTYFSNDWITHVMPNS